MRKILALVVGLALVGSWAWWKLKPDDADPAPPAKTLQGDQCLAEGKYLDAARLYRDAALEAPPGSKTDYQRLQALLDQIDDQVAVDELSQIFATVIDLYKLKQQPANLPKRSVELYRLHVERDVAGAKKLLQALAPLAPMPPPLFVARELFAANKTEAAHVTLQECLKDPATDPQTRFAVAQLLAEVGAGDQARAILEELYRTVDDPQRKQWLAGQRAGFAQGWDDQLAWLAKADGSDPAIKAFVALARSQKARQEDRSAEAILFAGQALEIFAKLQQQPQTLRPYVETNVFLYQLTGEQDYLKQSIAGLEKAVDLAPRDTNVLASLADSHVDDAVWDVAGEHVDLKLLKRFGTPDLVGYLYDNAADRDAVLLKLKEHIAVHKARRTYERMSVIAPQDPRPLQALANLNFLVRELEPFRKLLAHAEKLKLPAEDPRRLRDRLLAPWKEPEQADWGVNRKRQEELVTLARKKGGLTLAVALGNHVQWLLGAEAYIPDLPADAMLAWAEEAVRIAPSRRTRAVFVAALLHRAHRQLSQDPGYAAFAKSGLASLGSLYLVPLALNGKPLAKLCQENADVRRAQELVLQRSATHPEEQTELAWALLRGVHPEAAEKLASFSRRDDFAALERRASVLFAPFNGPEVMRSHWYWLMRDQPDQADRVLRDFRAHGLPLP